LGFAFFERLGSGACLNWWFLSKIPSL
jgi:hypothetical protein